MANFLLSEKSRLNKLAGIPNSFDKLCEEIRDDIILADAVLLPYSYPLSIPQVATMREYEEAKFIFHQAIRGGSKSYITARFDLVYGLTHKLKAVMTAPTYRQALLVFNYTVDLVKENSTPGNPLNLSRELDGHIVGGGSIEARMKFKNGSGFKALPMADGVRLRGERADILHCDEFFKMEKAMFKTHVLPFLYKPTIKPLPGSLMPPQTESKLIVTTSAEYEDCYAYHFLVNTMLPKIREQDETGSKKIYSIIDWRYDDLVSLGYNLEKEVIELQIGDASPEEKDRALNNRWVGISGQFFPSNLAERLATPAVTVEHSGEEGGKYSFTIDVATVKGGDDFVIHVWKFIGNRKMALVNTYFDNGLSNDDMAFVIHEYDQKFFPEHIMMDKAGGGLFVQQALTKRKLILQNKNLIAQYGDEHDIKVPLLLHDEIELYGSKKIVFNKANDPLIQGAFAGVRTRSGEFINSEDILQHFIFDNLKKMIMAPDPLFVIPYSAHVKYQGDGEDAEGERYMGSEQNIIDNIRESVHQLRHLRIQTITTSDGREEIVLSKMGKVPKYIWRNAKKDGAVCFTYGIIPYLLHYKEERGMMPGDTGMIIQPDMFGSSYFQGLYEDPSQVINPFMMR